MASLNRLALRVSIVLLLGALTSGVNALERAAQGAKPLDGVPTFDADPKWPALPADFKWGQVIGIFADSRGHVWTSSQSRIAEWDPQGTLVQSWDARGPDGNWSTIHGMFVDHNGFVWTNARESHLTVKFTRAGKVALVIGKFNETGGSNDTTLMGRPSEIWVDPADNEVFVADGYGNRRIIVFDGATGKYLRHWGAYGKRPEDPAPRGGGGGAAGRGDAAGRGVQAAPAVAPAAPPQQFPATPPQQFNVPHGITGSRDGLIYLADRANNRLQVFRQNGEYVTERILRPRCGAQEQATWTPKRTCGTEAAFSIGFSHDAPQTYMYVADGGSHVITVLRRSDLEVVSEFGGPGVGPGQLGRPHNLSVDPSGNIFVAEAAGPMVKHPVTGEMVGAGYRAQKFTFTGTRQTPAQPPAFRAGADAIVVDARVVDKNGKPVADLTADEFLVRVDGTPRRVTSRYETAASAEQASSVLVAVDRQNLRPATSRATLDAAATFVEALPASHAVGLIVLPEEKVTVAIGQPRSQIVKALRGMLGTYNPRIPIGDDELSARSALHRVISLMSTVQGRRTVVFLADRMNDSASTLDTARRAALQSVAFYVVAADAPAMTAENRGSMSDDGGISDGLAALAVASGGALLRRSAGAHTGLDRIALELSGQYVLTLDTEPPDRGRHAIRVSVKREGLDVRARREFVK